MKNIIVKMILLWMLLIAVAGCATTQGGKQATDETSMPTITSIQIEEHSLIIQGGSHFNYTLYKSADPYRATIEISGISAGSFTGKMVSDKGGIAEIVTQQIDSPQSSAKIDIVLQTPSALVPEYKDNTLVLTLKKEDPISITETRKDEDDNKRESTPLVRMVAEEKPVEKANNSSAAKATEIKNVDIKKTADSVKVIITGNGPMIPNVFPINERIVVDIPDVALHAALPSQTITPLKSIRAGKHKDKLRLVLDLREKTNFDVTAIGNTIEISLVGRDSSTPQKVSYPAARETESVIAPLSTAVKNQQNAEPIADGKYTGKKISLDFQDADVIPIFRLLGDISGYNMVVNPEVKGKITLKLINVPWDQALDVVLKTFSLSKIVDGNVIRIVPTAIMAKELDEMTRAKKAASEAGELKTKIFPVNYAQLDKLKDAVDKAKILSSRGSLSVDERGSSIIVNDVDANLSRIEALIKELDQEYMQARQVIIEARIVEVNAKYAKALGVQWGTYYKEGGLNTLTVGSAGRSSTSAAPDWLVNLPASTTFGSIGLGYLSRAATFALDVRLSAMEDISQGKIVSSPKIMTMNNEAASIVQGRQLQLPSTDNDGKTTLKAVPLNLALNVTPRITPGGSVLMKVNITKDELIDFITAPDGSSVGADTAKNEITTSVLINNGETLVIGGIFKESKREREKAIPGLSKLPILGLLFKNEDDEIINTELLVFITPRIVETVSIK